MREGSTIFVVSRRQRIDVHFCSLSEVVSSGSFFRPSLEGLGLGNSGLGSDWPNACGRLSAGGRMVFHEMTIMWVPMRTIVFFQYIVH